MASRAPPRRRARLRAASAPAGFRGRTTLTETRGGDDRKVDPISDSDPRILVDRILSLAPTADLLERAFPDLDPEVSFARLYQLLLEMFWSDPAHSLAAVRHLRTALAGSNLRRDALLARLEGHGLSRVGRSAEATEHYRAASDLFARAGDELEQARTSTGWAFALTLAGKPEEAASVGRRGRRLLKGRDPVLAARIETNVATGWQLAGRFDRASASFASAFSELIAAGLPADAGLVAHNLGVLAFMTGRNDEAVAHLSRALELFGDDPKSPSLPSKNLQPLYSRTVLAAIDLTRGKWDDGLQKIAALRQVFESTGDARARGWLHRELALLFSSLGAPEAAAPEADAAIRVFEEGGLALDAAHAAVLHGHLLARQGRVHEAAQRLNEAREQFSRTGDRWQLHRLDLEQARLSLISGQIPEARAALGRVKRDLQRTDPAGAGAIALGIAAEIHLRERRYRRAIQYATEAYRAARLHPAASELPRIALVAAEAHAELAEHPQAMRWMRRAVRELEKNLFRFGSRRMRVLVGGARTPVYGAAVDLALRSGGRNAQRIAVELLSRAGSPNLIESMRQRSRDGLSRDLRSAVMRLRDEMLTTAPAGDVSRARAFHAQISSLQRKLDESALRPEIARRALDDRRFERWSRRLAGRDLALFDRSSGGAWRAFLVRPDRSVHLVELPEAELALEKSWFAFHMLVETAGRLPAERRAAFLERTNAESASHWNRLRSALWDPIPWSSDRVVIVPHAELEALPLEALSAAENRIVSRLPHPALLRAPRKRPRRSALLLHGPEQGMKEEVEEIAAILTRAGLAVRTGHRRADLESAQKVDALHVAAHGTFHPVGWLLSGLQLSDGWFGLEQLRFEQLDGALVHFTSCESGRTGRLPGTDLEGWSSAALTAGARELVLAAWRIEEAAAHRFATLFYERWAKGDDVATAVHQARLELRAHFPHPYHWAAHIAIG